MGWVHGRTVSPMTSLALIQNQLSLLAPLKPFSSLEVPATLAAGR